MEFILHCTAVYIMIVDINEQNSIVYHNGVKHYTLKPHANCKNLSNPSTKHRCVLRLVVNVVLD